LCELAYRFDRELPAELLTETDGLFEPRVSPTDLAELIRILKNVRQGTSREALAAFQRETSRALLERFSAICSIEQLNRWVDNPPHDLAETQALLQLELVLTCLLEELPLPTYDQSWALEWSDTSALDWNLPELSNVTEFNPDQNIYRDGRWHAR
jgi:hypothetical protein